MENFKEVIDNPDELGQEQISKRDMYEKGEDGKYVSKFVTRDKLHEVEEKMRAELQKEKEEEMEVFRNNQSNLKAELDMKDQQLNSTVATVESKKEREKEDYMKVALNSQEQVSKLNLKLREMAKKHEDEVKMRKEVEEKWKRQAGESHKEKIYRKLEQTFSELGMEDVAYKNDVHREACRVFIPHEEHGMVVKDKSGEVKFKTPEEGDTPAPVTPADWLREQLSNGEKAIMWRQGCKKMTNKSSGIEVPGAKTQNMTTRERRKANERARLIAVTTGQV